MKYVEMFTDEILVFDKFKWESLHICLKILNKNTN